MSNVRIAVIGVGHLGQHHARILNQLPGCELVAVVDRSRRQAEAVAKKIGCPQAFKRYRRIYDMVDAVSIAVPTSLHHEVASEFLQRGIHCMVEKPIATTVEEAEDLIRLAGENQCVLQVGHIERYNAAIRHLREILDKPGFVECHRLGPFTSRVADVGVVLDLMIHDIDIVLQLVDSPIKSVDAMGVSILTDKEDIATVRIRFENGCTANLTASRASFKVQRKLRVFQRDSYVSIDYDRQSMQYYQRVPRNGAEDGGPTAEIRKKRVRLKKEDKLTLELADFVKAVSEGARPNVTGEHARDALSLAVQIARGDSRERHGRAAGVEGPVGDSLTGAQGMGASMAKRLKIFLVSGENSGDQPAGRLISRDAADGSGRGFRGSGWSADAGRRDGPALQHGQRAGHRGAGGGDDEGADADEGLSDREVLSGTGEARCGGADRLSGFQSRLDRPAGQEAGYPGHLLYRPAGLGVASQPHP